MAVTDGQPVNAAVSNNAWMSRLVDTSTVGKVDLQNLSNTELLDLQRIINELLASLGVSNQAATDANANVYSSNNVVTDGDDRKVAIGKLDGEFDIATGHDHDGVNSKPVSAANLDDFNNLFAEFGENTFDAASGTSIDVSTEFSGKTPGGDAVTEGVITTLPNNYIPIVEKSDGGEIEDGEGDRVFGRLTESGGTWTLSFFTNESGTETAHNLSSQDIRFLYREVFTAANRPTIGANVAVYDTQSAIGDIPDATATQRGVVSTTGQTFAGIKEFQDRPTTNSIDIADISSAQVITNKDIDGGTASNTSRITIPSDTTANLNLLTRKAGNVYYSTDELIYYGDNGTDLVSLGSGEGGGAGGFDIIDSFDAEDEDVTGFTNITTTGVSPIAGSFSYSVDSYPASFPTSSVEPRNLRKTGAAVFHASLTSGTARFLVKDQSSNTLSEIEFSETEVTKVLMPISINSSVTSLVLEVEDASSATGLKMDDVFYTDDAVRGGVGAGTNSEIQVDGHAGFAGSGANSILLYSTLERNIGNDIVYDAGNGTFTVQSDGIYHFNGRFTVGAVGLTLAVRRNSTTFAYDTDTLAVNEGSASGDNVGFAGSRELEAGDVIRVIQNAATAPLQPTRTQFRISKIGNNPVNVISSTDSFGPVIAQLSSNQNISDSTETIVNFDNVLYDDDNLVTTGASWKWTAPRAGFISVQPTIIFNGTGQVDINETWQTRIYKNGGSFKRGDLRTSFGSPTSMNMSLNGSAVWDVQKGDEIDVRVFQNTGDTQAIASGNPSYVSIHYIDKKPLALVDVQSKFQTKFLAANFTTNAATMTDLTFNNLTVGKAYTVHLSPYFRVNNTAGPIINILNGATQIGRVTFKPTTAGNSQAHFTKVHTFIATDTVLTFLTASFSASTFAQGNGTQDNTSATLIEVQNLIETSEWT